MEIPTGSTLYFDANIFIGINPQKCNQLRQLTAAKKVKCSCPPRVLMEIFSHINSDEKGDFKHYQAALRKQKKICSDRILPYREHILANYFGLDRPPDKMAPLENLIQARDCIINSKGYDELLQKTLPFQNLVSGEQVPFENHWRDFRENYESAWVDRIYSAVEAVYNLISSDVAKGAPNALAGKGDEEIRKALNHLKFKRDFLNMMTQIAGGKCPNELSASRVDELIKPVEAHFSAYMKVLAGSLKRQHSRDKLKNDYNDLELLQYLGLKDHFFITNDKNLRKKVDDSCDQKKRILTFDEAIEKLKN